MNVEAQETWSRRRFRTVTRLLALAAVVVLLLPILPWSEAAMVPTAVSPFVAVGSAVAARSVGVATLVGLPVLVLSLFLPRWFCRYACPVGLLSETFARVRASAGASLARWPAVGQWVALLTLGGAFAGYPLLLWLDPLALASAFVGAWRWPLTLAGLVAAGGLLSVLLLSVLVPHAWCMRLCPLGAVQDLLARLRQRGLSPTGAREPAAGAAGHLPRRTLLALGLGGVGALAVRAVHGRTPPPLRPPGAVPEDRFTGLCVRCGNCVRVCPSHIIRPDLGRHGIAGLLAPVLCFDENYCLEDCHRCNAVCPSGAIARLTLDGKRREVIGVARPDLDLCLLAKGQDCTACLRACPYDAIRLVQPEGGFTSEPRVDRDRCNGCGACQAACPTEPRKAIRVYPPLECATAGLPGRALCRRP